MKEWIPVTLLCTLLPLVAYGSYEVTSECRVHEQRCEAWCREDCRPGALRRTCYEKCLAEEVNCRKYGNDEP